MRKLRIVYRKGAVPVVVAATVVASSCSADVVTPTEVPKGTGGAGGAGGEGGSFFVSSTTSTGGSGGDGVCVDYAIEDTFDVEETITPAVCRAAHRMGAIHIIRGLNLAVRKDTVTELRRIARFSETTSVTDRRAVQRFAVEAALAINGRDLSWRAKTDELWQRLNARGVALMTARGHRRPTAARADYGIATGS